MKIVKKHLVLLTAFAISLMALTATDCCAVMVYQTGDNKAADMFVYNNTKATVSINTSCTSTKGWSSTTVQPMSVSGATNIHLSSTSYGADCKVSQGGTASAIGFTINDPATPYNFQVGQSSSTQGTLSDYFVWFTLVASDPSWTTTQGAVAPNGAVALPPLDSAGMVEQMWNSGYIVTFFAAPGDDNSSNVTGTKIIVMINPNTGNIRYNPVMNKACNGGAVYNCAWWIML